MSANIEKDPIPDLNRLSAPLPTLFPARSGKDEAFDAGEFVRPKGAHSVSYLPSDLASKSLRYIPSSSGSQSAAFSNNSSSSSMKPTSFLGASLRAALVAEGKLENASNAGDPYLLQSLLQGTGLQSTMGMPQSAYSQAGNALPVMSSQNLMQSMLYSPQEEWQWQITEAGNGEIEPVQKKGEARESALELSGKIATFKAGNRLYATASLLAKMPQGIKPNTLGADIVFLADKSSSMDGIKITHLKKALL